MYNGLNNCTAAHQQDGTESVVLSAGFLFLSIILDVVVLGICARSLKLITMHPSYAGQMPAI